MGWRDKTYQREPELPGKRKENACGILGEEPRDGTVTGTSGTRNTLQTPSFQDPSIKKKASMYLKSMESGSREHMPLVSALQRQNQAEFSKFQANHKRTGLHRETLSFRSK